MTIDITFAELSEYVRNHYGKKLTFKKLSLKEICVSYEQRILIKTIQFPVNLKIDKVTPDAVALTYSGGLGIEMIISGVLSLLKSGFPELSEVLTAEDGHRICVQLTALKATKKIVEKITLTDIEILEDAIRVTASLK